MSVDARAAIGKRSEELASEYLEAIGFGIIEKNWNSSCGEIDIIAQKSDLLVFVEVRCRKMSAMVTPLESVNKIKISKIKKAAQLYVYDNNTDNLYCRFDVIAIEYIDDLFFVSNHITDAF